jgi:hypothetical protein
LRLNIFEVCTIESPLLLWWRMFCRSFVFFARFEHENRLSSGLVFYSKLSSESLEAFFELGFSHDRSKGCFRSGLYYMGIRVVIPYPSNYVSRASRASMLYEQRVSILRFAVFGLAPSFCFLSCGF